MCSSSSDSLLWFGGWRLASEAIPYYNTTCIGPGSWGFRECILLYQNVWWYRRIVGFGAVALGIGTVMFPVGVLSKGTNRPLRMVILVGLIVGLASASVIAVVGDCQGYEVTYRFPSGEIVVEKRCGTPLEMIPLPLIPTAALGGGLLAVGATNPWGFRQPPKS